MSPSSISPLPRIPSLLACVLLGALLLGLAACRGEESAEPSAHAHDSEGGHHDSDAAEPEPWSVTAWSEHYELFAETEPLIARVKASSHAHFTYLPDFSALNEGSVTGVLRGADGREETFLAPKPTRAGIFTVVFEPQAPGIYELLFRVANDKVSEEVAAGRVEVGTAQTPGDLAASTAEAGVSSGADSATAGEPISFLKEQQWRTRFSTAVAQQGSLRQSIRAPGRVEPTAQGEVTLTAPADGTVASALWPHAGVAVARGAMLFTLSPRVAADKSRAVREADVVELDSELTTARARLGRLRELLAVEAASRREVEEVETRVQGLSARLEAARRDVASAALARVGKGSASESFRVSAPLGGRVAQVLVSPGEFVAAGSPLARIVQESPVWLALALTVEQASTVTAPLAGLVVRRWAGDESIVLRADEVRLISRAPEVDAQTGSVAVIVEVERDVDLFRLGSRVEAEIFLAAEIPGVVVPASSLVDDSGVEVIYVQLDGESFERREVEVLGRQGDLCRVRGLREGERIVTLGGNAVRRSALLGSGAVEGHVH